ncbi:protein-glutamate methylesterase/protein-glutamine glutaminase [Rariglobus hedericola]|uniref:Protein-glutamate methylesterase/protein-glutamine glutaminase n=1 Tax=Rariglobus hedericola TaxID=2597822 RepID=A0A556QPU1_9BACT|nr:chemotaxis response regulator protein-glutamate methylesterase [Rariglobus hedericola]TSJ78663.1 chemotaxis response regulator protein-glutamate methylesterase [Rariglobus hedericola]
MSPPKIRVLIVDDSAVVRKLVTEALAHDPAIEVVGTAVDPIIARTKIEQLNPDVITLDIEMPRMDGLTYLREIMETRPRPVIIMSSLSKTGSTQALEALRLGAVDVLGKPGGAYSFGDLGPQLCEKIKAAAVARLRPKEHTPALATAPASLRTTAATAINSGSTSPSPLTAREVVARIPLSTTHRQHHPRRIILLGASTGGTEALRSVLTRLPAGLPGIAIVQHIPPVFSKAFADRLNTLCAFPVREAVDGDRLTPSLALIAPGGRHLVLQWSSDGYRVRLSDWPAVWHQRPAVDILFKSAVECAGPQAIAGVFTGMGKDGAEGLLRLREKGALTFSQDEASSIVYGMPRAAWEQGGSQKQISLPMAAQHIVSLVETTSAAPPMAGDAHPA